MPYASGWRKWIPASVMMLCSWLSYVDRQILAVLSPAILRETGFSAEQYSQVIAAFSLAYTIANPLWGSLLDRIGLRTGMLIAVAIWTAASASHAWAAGLVGFVFARIVLGFGEGATFPGGLRAALESLPQPNQARGMAIAYSGGSLGAILTPLIVVPIALRFGWRDAFLVTGGLGCVWLGVWWRFARPPYLPVQAAKSTRFFWPNFTERRFWALVASYGLGAIPLGPMLYLSPLYLNRVVGLSQGTLGKVLWIPPLGWEAGYFFWGWAADRYALSQKRPVRFFVILALLGLPLGLVTQVHAAVGVLAIFFWTMFVGAGFLVLSLRTAALSYPREQTSLVAGIGAGAWSAMVAAVLPLCGRWFDRGAYRTTFLTVCLLPVLGTALWIWLSERD